MRLLNGIGNRHFSIIILLLMFALMMFIISGCQNGESAMSSESQDNVAHSEPQSYDAPEFENGNVETVLEESAKSGLYIKHSNVESAANDAPFRPRVPSDSLGRNLIGIYTPGQQVLEAEGGKKDFLGYSLTVLYEDGLHINETILPHGATYEGIVDTYKQLGANEAEELPVRVEFDGMKGYGQDCGYNVIDGEKEPRPGYIVWSESWSGKYITYQVYGDGMKVKDLEKVVKSMH